VRRGEWLILIALVIAVGVLLAVKGWPDFNCSPIETLWCGH
jgi:hypothetical protein